MAELSTKSGIFETGVKDEYGVAYKDGRVVGSYNRHLTEYTVRDGTKVICDRAFYDKKELRQLHLPSSVKAIGEGAFAGCKALVDINIPEGVTEIRQSTFRDCDALVAVELPKSVNKIGQFAFAKGLTTIVINAPAADIHRFAFMNCRNLKTVLVPEGCINDYVQAFLHCGFMPQLEEMKEEHIAEEISTSEKGTINQEPDLLETQENNLITNQKENSMGEFNLLRILPELDSAYAYRIGTPSDDIDSSTLEDTYWELYFAQAGCEGTYELVDENYDYEEGNFDLVPCRRLSSIISALNQDNPEELSSEEIMEIKAIYGNPKFDKGVPGIYQKWIKSLSKPGMTEEEAVVSLFKAIIKDTDIENPVGIEVDASEEEQMRICYNINVGEKGFDIDKIKFLSFDCLLEDYSLAFETLQDHEIALLNLVLYDGVFYHNNTADDDGFVWGCELIDSYKVDGTTLGDYEE